MVAMNGSPFSASGLKRDTGLLKFTGVKSRLSLFIDKIMARSQSIQPIPGQRCREEVVVILPDAPGSGLLKVCQTQDFVPVKKSLGIVSRERDVVLPIAGHVGTGVSTD